jgi:thiamine biosynthesis protein ThiS
VLIKIGGNEIEIPDGSSVKQLVLLKGAPDNIVVVLNGNIVELEQWEDTALTANDEVELIQFVAGG